MDLGRRKIPFPSPPLSPPLASAPPVGTEVGWTGEEMVTMMYDDVMYGL